MNAIEKSLDTDKSSSPHDEELLKAVRQAKLRTALKALEGIWKDRTDIPKDGVEFERMLRDEWD